MTGDDRASAIVWCEGAFDTPNGKTAHGLVRRTERYRIRAVIDSHLAGRTAGDLLPGVATEIPVVKSLADALVASAKAGAPATHFVIGLAPDGGRLPPLGREAVKEAIRAGLDVDSGLHDFLTDDREIAALAREHGVTLRDVRKTPSRDRLHGFTGKIEEVESFRVALLGTDSAVGKRTTCWLLADALRAAGHPAEVIGTGQTAWLQGARYGIILDSLINDFVAGELEHAAWSAWRETGAEVLIFEGQGSLMNPAYPGGFEILAAGRPHVVLLQHAPKRREYDGFPGYPIHPIDQQIRAIELVSGRPVVAVTVNHENLAPEAVPAACAEITEKTGLPAVDVLLSGATSLVDVLRGHGLMDRSRGEAR